MTIALSTIAQQALRRLGVRIVPLDDSPTLTELVPVQYIATQALVELGIYNVYEASYPLETVQASDIATAALVELGVLNSADPPLTETATATDIATNALIELGVIASDEIPTGTTPDLTVVLDKVGSVHGALVAQGIATWGADAIPINFVEDYIKLTAVMSASSFGKTGDPAVVAMLQDRIRKGAMVLHNGPGFMLGQVSAVHDSLIAQGIAPWSIGAIPRAFYEEYVKLTASYAAASFGVSIEDPKLVAVLVDRIRQGSMVMTVDQDFLLGKVASVHAALDAQGVVWWDGTAIPRAFVEEYIKLTVAHAAASLGKQIDPAIIPALEARVRKGAMVLSADDNANQAVQAVHDDLVMRGIARWTSFDIPDALSDPYVVLAADALAPLFEVQINPRDTQDAMVAIYRYVALPTSGETVRVAYF